MVNLTESQCSGCGACFNACPTDAIDMVENSNGFIYPRINPENCIKCNICEKVCPELNHSFLQTPSRAAYAAVAKDIQSRYKSASGGVAYEISKRIIEKGGVVYGCSMNDVEHVQHVRCTSIDDINLLRGSKYVHSNINDTYKKVKSDLSNNKTVLFVGTPCQVSGLKSYLRTDYSTLFTMDLICHGVPSQKILKEEVHRIVGYCHSLDDLVVNFRWKESNHKSSSVKFGMQIRFKNKRIKKLSRINSPYMAAFFSGYTYRENCHNCRYATHNRVGDLTIGDFWGLGETIRSNLDIEKGVSMILINSNAGEELLQNCLDRVVIETHSMAEAIKHNHNLSKPTPRPDDKSDFLSSMQQKGLLYAVNKYIPSYKKERSLSYRMYLVFARFWHTFKSKNC